MNNTLGVHYILDFYNCDSKCLMSVKTINKIMLQASKIGNFNVIKSCIHQFKPFGVSGVMVLKESHFTIHTWPEYSYAAIDIFLCNLDADIVKVIKYLKLAFKTSDYKEAKLERGIE